MFQRKWIEESDGRLVPRLRQIHAAAPLLFQVIGEPRASIVLAVYQPHRRMFLNRAVPVRQAVAIGMRGQAANGVYVRTYRDVVAEQVHVFGAIHDAPAERALCLITDE